MRDKNYEELANAIVLQAAKDYRAARRELKRHPKSKEAPRMMKECERFFLSEWFVALTAIDGGRLLKKLQEEEI